MFGISGKQEWVPAPAVYISHDCRASPFVCADRRNPWRSGNATLPHSSAMCFCKAWQRSLLNFVQVEMAHTRMAEHPSSAWGARNITVACLVVWYVPRACHKCRSNAKRRIFILGLKILA